MLSNQKSFSKYLPVSPDAIQWGLHVTDCGYTQIAPGEPYPPLSSRPESYALSWEQGRTFSEYQVIYITRGSGFFEADGTGTLPVSAGTVLLLFPGVWHRYRPEPGTGWDEFWIGFNGEHAARLMKRFFDAARPVLSVGLHEPLLARFIAIAEFVQNEPFGYRNIIASQTMEVLARVHARSQGRAIRSPASEELARRACCHLLEHAESTVDMKQLARELGVSYSSFRRIFKQHTGLPPAQYHLQLRLLKAENLLRSTVMPIGEVAEQTGFESIYYFSRIFKKKNGVAPSEFRKESVAGIRASVE
jgi:AraC-like DNA-binding protein